MKLKLVSNYKELWFSAFDKEGFEFRLMNDEGPNKIEQFNLFKKIKLNSVFNGYYSDFLKINYEKSRKVVIYDNIRSHFGQDKRLVVFSELNSEDKLKYMSEYIEMPKMIFTDYLAKSLRILCVGDYCFTYDYFSYNDWRSNNGKIFISDPIRLDVPSWRDKIHYAMFAVDFVGEAHDLKAIDFNISPGIDSRLHKLLPASMMVLGIKEWLKKYMREEC